MDIKQGKGCSGRQYRKQINSKVPKGRTGVTAITKDTQKQTVAAFEITTKGEEEKQRSERARRLESKCTRHGLAAGCLKLAWLALFAWV